MCECSTDNNRKKQTNKKTGCARNEMDMDKNEEFGARNNLLL